MMIKVTTRITMIWATVGREARARAATTPRMTATVTVTTRTVVATTITTTGKMRANEDNVKI